MPSYDDIEYYPGDPILGLADLYAADTHPQKVNLGVGIYLDEQGRLPLPECVEVAERRIAANPAPRGYIPIGGLPDYVARTQEVVFGADSPLLEQQRVASVQTLGGSGALKEGADFLRGLLGASKMIMSNPSWANHQAIFEGAGYEVGRYRYHDDEAHGVDVDGMLADLAAAEPGTVVVLHACCHNPTGYDIDEAQWRQVAEGAKRRELVPFLDMAYQGFAEGLEADRVAIRVFAESGQRFCVGNSFSKTFGLYGERVGALHLVCRDDEEAVRVRSQLCRVIRTNYSNPPTHGARVVSEVLGDEQLRASWETELAGMRERIRRMREALVTGLREEGVEDMDFVAEQNGMFSNSGLSVAQMHQLRSDFGVYGTDDGRMCVAGLNEDNVQVVARAIAQVRRAEG
ncbi:amino acid aminotransferase [Luteococcus peritonei]|uniref:Aminotransferase n=1 Tax=Luteococcus peritonei TaxID=88874 RepID=A0ABW4RUW5_9ACTN